MHIRTIHTMSIFPGEHWSSNYNSNYKSDGRNDGETLHGSERWLDHASLDLFVSTGTQAAVSAWFTCCLKFLESNCNILSVSDATMLLTRMSLMMPNALLDRRSLSASEDVKLIRCLIAASSSTSSLSLPVPVSAEAAAAAVSWFRLWHAEDSNLQMSFSDSSSALRSSSSSSAQHSRQNCQ